MHATNTKYGIKCIPLSEYLPHFMDDCDGGKLQWLKIGYIEQRISYFLSFIAKIKPKYFECRCCLPYQSSSAYVVFVSIDGGNQMMLLLTIKDDSFHLKSWKNIEWLKAELLLLDAPYEDLRSISLKIPDGMHPA